MWLRRVDPAFVVGEVLASTSAPATGAMPTYSGGYGAPDPAADPRRAQAAPPRA
jgi:MoxR-like ATPase